MFLTGGLKNVHGIFLRLWPRSTQGQNKVKKNGQSSSLYFYKCALYLFLNIKEARCQDDVNLNTFNLKQLEF